jgi:hypothetical protein
MARRARTVLCIAVSTLVGPGAYVFLSWFMNERCPGLLIRWLPITPSTITGVAVFSAVVGVLIALRPVKQGNGK